MQAWFCGCTTDSGGTMGFWWCICRITGGAFRGIKDRSTSIRVFFCGKCYGWQTIDGLHMVIHDVVSHLLVYFMDDQYQNVSAKCHGDGYLGDRAWQIIYVLHYIMNLCDLILHIRATINVSQPNSQPQQSMVGFRCIHDVSAKWIYCWIWHQTLHKIDQLDFIFI